MFAIVSLALIAFTEPGQAALSPRELAPGVFVLGSSHAFHATNVGWVVLPDRVILIGLPDPKQISNVLRQVARTSAMPVKTAVMLQPTSAGIETAVELGCLGIGIVIHKDAARDVRAAAGRSSDKKSTCTSLPIIEFSDQTDIGSGNQKIELIAQPPFAGPGAGIAYIPHARVLFAGPLCTNGPRVELRGTNTLTWLFALENLPKVPISTVVPGRGSVGDGSLLDRQRRFLGEIRRQVGHHVAQGRSLDDIVKEVKIAPDFLVWMPYDHPVREDIEHVYGELSVPIAPFGNPDRLAMESKPRALVLIGDRPHDPGHIERSLGRVLDSAGIVPLITVDVRALSAQNLRKVQLLVMLRDGSIWPNGRDKPAVGWMTSEQERAVVSFVEAGGGMVALHNTTALYPENGPFLELVGGKYTTHGPLERFRVSVVDGAHPITQGVHDFEVADEQHTPIANRARVHLLLESRADDGTIGAAGWAHQVGRGRVCYLANGHTRDAHNHPEFQKLLHNAALWCLSGGVGTRSR